MRGIPRYEAAGKRLRCLTILTNVNATELAACCDVRDVSTISSYSHGYTQPNVTTGIKIANALGVSVTDIWKVES